LLHLNGTRSAPAITAVIHSAFLWDTERNWRQYINYLEKELSTLVSSRQIPSFILYNWFKRLPSERNLGRMTLNSASYFYFLSLIIFLVLKEEKSLLSRIGLSLKEEFSVSFSDVQRLLALRKKMLKCSAILDVSMDIG